MELPRTIFSGRWTGGHCQGIALDTRRECIYYSFTTMLIKTDLAGNLIGTVTGLLGHLGCIAFNDADGRLYGSLEYKQDAIGRGILKNLGSDAALEDGFYIVRFDVDQITRPGMDACADGVMTAVHLQEVLDDYAAQVTLGGQTVEHRHGCSGIDGVTFAPIPGSSDDRRYLFVAYGVYGDVTRADNDYQVLLCYDTADWDALAQPLSQERMHRSGPKKPLHKFFVPTGNTTYGVQNLEYDSFTDSMLMAVYPGKKEAYANYSLFAVDGSVAPVTAALTGVEPTTEGELLTLRPKAWHFPYGATGLFALGDGQYYISEEGRDGREHFTTVRLYRWDGEAPFVYAE